MIDKIVRSIFGLKKSKKRPKKKSKGRRDTSLSSAAARDRSRKKGRGWYGEKARHSRAAKKGIRKSDRRR